MGRKCRVKDCLSDSRRPEDLGVTFHKVPFHADIRPKWLSLCKIHPVNQTNKIIYVCSRHFRRNDFCTFKGTKYMLRQGVLPSMFPWIDHTEVKPSASNKQKSSDDQNEDSTSDVESDAEASESAVDEVKKIIEAKTKRQKNEIKKAEVMDTKVEEKRKNDKTESKLCVNDPKDTKTDDSELSDSKDSISQEYFVPVTDFTQGCRVEVTDFSGAWLPARISEVDYTENEVFVEFEESMGKSNEWIPMDSKRLRQYVERNQFEVGERVMAMWKNSMKFPAKIQKSLGNDSYKVLFDDDIEIVLKSSKISKTNQSTKKNSSQPKSHPSPLFAPVEGSKQDRRDRKRKINVAELFNKKRLKTDGFNTGQEKPLPKESNSVVPSCEKEADEKESLSNVSTPKANVTNKNDKLAFSPTSGDWICRWMNGEPVGVPCVLDSRRSVIVDDPKLPAGWTKHFVCRAQGSSAGKWDAVVISPEGKKFRSKNDLQPYLEKEKLGLTIDLFDFSLHLKKARSLGFYEFDENVKTTPRSTPVPPKVKAITPKVEVINSARKQEKEPGANSLKIICMDGAFKCPIEGCEKTFRKENLAQMHVKHYHPEFSKFIGSTPNVADLAYARTVGEPIEDFLPKTRFNQSITVPSGEKKSESTPKTPARNQPQAKAVVTTPVVNNVETDNLTIPETTAQDGIVATPKVKKSESEIVKILNRDSVTPASPDAAKTDQKQCKTSSTAANINSELNQLPMMEEPVEKIEPIVPTVKADLPKENKFIEHYRKEEVKPSGGIKTLLPVIRNVQDRDSKLNTDRIARNIVDDLPYKSHLMARNANGKQLKTNRRRYTPEQELFKRRRYTKNDYDYYGEFNDSDSKSPELPTFNRKKKSVEFGDGTSIVPQDIPAPHTSQQIVTETGEVIKIVSMKQEEIINCTCGFMEEDGLMIQCELCLCWQHAYCNSIEREDQVPDKYICYICQNPLRMRASKKYIHDQDWLKQGTLASANYHVKDEDLNTTKFENLRKSHELSGNLLELAPVLHSLRVKLKIAENKDHPKFYLWSKPWPIPTTENNIRDILQNIQAHKYEEKIKNMSCKDNKLNLSLHQNDIESSLKNLLSSGAGGEIKQSDFDSHYDENEHIKNESIPQSNNELLNILEGNETPENKNPDSLSSCEALSKQSALLLSSEPKSEPKNWMDGSGMYGEVSDGEMISQALASEALATGLLSSPTTALNLALSQSDIEKIQNTIENSGSIVKACVPEPEVKIEPDVCRDNLLDNICHCQQIINLRMDAVEECVRALEAETLIPEIDKTENATLQLKETLLMVTKDLMKARRLAALY